MASLRNVAAMFVMSIVVDAFLHTEGNLIKNSSDGSVVRLACVNWYGAQLERFVVNGLDKRPREDISSHIASLGFNCVRLVFSTELFYKNPTVSASAVIENMDLADKPAMVVFDAVVEALTQAGIMVILNNHNTYAGWCCDHYDGSGLWYTKEYPAGDWKDMWIHLTERYILNDMVVGVDLRNEIRSNCTTGTPDNCTYPTWGTGDDDTDWQLVAQDCGNAILSKNSNLLIFVEGLEYANSLSRVKNFPIELQDTSRLVYSGHVYSWSENGCQPMFPTNNYNVFQEAVYQELTYVTTPNQEFTAPFWMGEFGTNSRDLFWNMTIKFLTENPHVHWAYWAMDGYKHDDTEEETFGIFTHDFKTIRHPWKIADLQGIQSHGV